MATVLESAVLPGCGMIDLLGRSSVLTVPVKLSANRDLSLFD